MYAYISSCTVSIDRTNHELVFVRDTWNQDGDANGVSRHVIQRVIETESQEKISQRVFRGVARDVNEKMELRSESSYLSIKTNGNVTLSTCVRVLVFETIIRGVRVIFL